MESTLGNGTVFCPVVAARLVAGRSESARLDRYSSPSPVQEAGLDDRSVVAMKTCPARGTGLSDLVVSALGKIERKLRPPGRHPRNLPDFRLLGPVLVVRAIFERIDLGQVDIHIRVEFYDRAFGCAVV